METQTEFISIKELAQGMGIDRSHARRYVLKLGIKPGKRRTKDSGSQLTLTVSQEEAQKIIEHRKLCGFTDDKKIVDSESGFFYVIQLVPEFDANRLKLGFANDLNDRLSQHRTAAPTAKILKSWPCKRSWEKTIMDCLSYKICRHILNEVFECKNREELIERGNNLFSILPDIKWRIELSVHSPHTVSTTK